ncbi:MAG: cupin domain-containing protein [Chitinophagales bacterium]
MEVNDLLKSGILEMYCLGVATQEEMQLVKQYAEVHPIIRNEIASIEEALVSYAFYVHKQPSGIVKEGIINRILQEEASVTGLPQLLSEKSTLEEWKTYLENNKIRKPDGDEALYMVEFSKTQNITTYIAWAEPGAFVEEEHADELERLFMLQGNCEIEVNGIRHFYKEGDFVEIKRNTLHKAVAVGERTMILIGQRYAA